MPDINELYDATGVLNRLTATGWMLYHLNTTNEMISSAKALSEIGGKLQWAWGDLWIAGSHLYGDMRKLTGDLRWTGPAYQSLANMASVAKRFEISRRRENLSWSHHSAVSSMTETDQEHWLDWAQQNAASIEALTQAINQRKTNGCPDTAPEKRRGKPRATPLSRLASQATSAHIKLMSSWQDIFEVRNSFDAEERQRAAKTVERIANELVALANDLWSREDNKRVKKLEMETI